MSSVAPIALFWNLLVGLTCLIAAAFPASEIQVNLSSESAILINAETGSILFEKNAHVSQYPASTTKVATALYALQQAANRLDIEVTASQDAIASISEASAKKQEEGKLPAHWLVVGGSHIGIKRGEVLPLRSLFYGMLLASGNDAANVIAQEVGGTIPAFVDGLNAYLKTIGCQNTHFVNPHGYSHPQHYTTAADMALIAKKAMEFPFFREVVRTTNYLRPQTNKQPAQMLWQTNKLLKQGPYYYPLAIGIKTGYTSKAAHNLVAAASNGERTLIAVMLHCGEKGGVFKDAAKLFDAGFAERIKTRRFLREGAQKYSTKVVGGAALVKTYLTEDLTYSYYPSEEKQVSAQLIWEKDLRAPIHAGTCVGHVELLSKDGVQLTKLPLLALEDVDLSKAYQLRQKVTDVTKNWKQNKMKCIAGLTLILVGLILWFLKKRRLA